MNILATNQEVSAHIKRDTVEAMNDRIVSNKEFELFDQQLNAIELDRLKAEVMYYPIEHQHIIENIATLCPVAGGPAVYKARAMLVLFNDTLVFYDDSVCTEQGYAYRLAQEQADFTIDNEKCIVYPNPSKSTFTVFTGIKSMVEVKVLTVYNTLGQIILSQNALGSQSVLDFHSKDLAQGIYTLAIHFPSSGRSEYQKLVYAP